MSLPAGSTPALGALLFEQARALGDRPALRLKRRGIWNTLGWTEYATQARRIAAALAERGVLAGDRIALIGDSRSHLFVTCAAAHTLGAAVVPLYPDASAEELEPILSAAGVAHVFAEDQQQVDKVLEMLPRLPAVRTIVFDSDRGMRHYRQPQLVGYGALLERAANMPAEALERVEATARAVELDRVAVLFPVTDAQGGARLAAHSHRSLLERATAAAAVDRLGRDDVTLAYLPPAWVAQFTFGYVQALVVGLCVACPESSETLLADLREIGPTYFVAPPRVLRSLVNGQSLRMEDAGRLKRALYDRALSAARTGNGGESGGLAALAADLLIRTPLRDVLGLRKVRVAYAIGAQVAPEDLAFLRRIGVNVKRAFGSAETGAFACLQPDDAVRPDAAGRPVAGLEMRVGPQGEIAFRGPGLFVGYTDGPSAPRDAEGWLNTGETGVIGADGQLEPLDRIADMVAFPDGTQFSPARVERRLKAAPAIREAVVYAAGPGDVVALLNIDPTVVAPWADRRSLTFSGPSELAALDAVCAWVGEHVAAVNASLARDPATAGSQVRRFTIVHKEFTAADGELARTGEPLRAAIARRWRPLIEAMHAGRADAHLDGAEGTAGVDLKIRDARATPALAKAA